MSLSVLMQNILARYAAASSGSDFMTTSPD